MADEAVLLVERDGPVTHLTLNRPDRLNALSAALADALLEAFEEAGRDGTRLVTIRGGGRGFSAGFDMSGLDQLSAGDLVLRFVRLEMMLQAVDKAPFATLALAHGACFGAAADLLSVCSRRVAAPDATFRMPGLQFGVVLGTRRLTQRVGTDQARRMLEDSRAFSAAEALKIGLIETVADISDWDAILADAGRKAVALPQASQRALYAMTRADTADGDLATLARSVAAPGFRNQILAYAAALKSRK